MTADLHVTHGLKGLPLGPKIGPLPAGAWVVVIGAGVYVGKRRSAAAAATADASTAAAGDPYGRADNAMVAATVAPASTGLPAEPGSSTSNDTWSSPSTIAPDFPDAGNDGLGSSNAPPITVVVQLPAPAATAAPAPATRLAPAPPKPSTRALSTFTAADQKKLNSGGLVVGGDGRTFQEKNGVPTTVSYARQLPK